jgi:hypothetical protein
MFHKENFSIREIRLFNKKSFIYAIVKCEEAVMTQTNLQEIFNEWQNNRIFREEFKQNPWAALKNAGFEVTPEDFSKIESMVKLKMDKSKSEELDDRINK